MLISKKVKIKTGSKNFNYYKKMGYIFDGMKDEIEVVVEHLTSGSHTIIDVECDYCGKLLKVPYKRYVKYTSICDKYSCSDIECSNKKIKDVCFIKYGVENPFQSDVVKDKIKKSFIDKYGVEHPMYIQETKDKIKKTCIENMELNIKCTFKKLKIK